MPAEHLAVEMAQQRQVKLGAVPRRTELIGGDRRQREGARRLALKKAEARGELGRDQGAQAHVVGEHDQLDMRAGLVGADAGRDRVGDHRDLGLEVDAPRLLGGDNGVVRPEKPVRAALVHQRLGPERIRQLGAARLAHQLDMVDVGAAVGPLEGARQGRLYFKAPKGSEADVSR